VFGIGETELVLILLFAFMIFGPDKLPGIGRTVGRALRQFRDAQEGFTKVVQTEIVDPATEAMNDAPKKPNRKRGETADDDADASAGSSERPAKSETFADRKKRLAAEKAARELDAAETTTSASVASDADADCRRRCRRWHHARREAPESEPAKPEASKPKPASAQDLYSMKPSRTVRAKKDVDSEVAPAAETPVEEPAATTGKEDGSERRPRAHLHPTNPMPIGPARMPLTDHLR